MRLFTRLVVCAATALLLSAFLSYFADSWLGENTSLLDAGRKLLFETDRSQALRVRAERVSRSLSLKNDIVNQLVVGRISFRQAIVQFQRANELIENVDLDLIPVYQMPADAEGVARQVFLWAYNAVVSWPPYKSQRFISNLAREYRTMFGKSISVEAPEAHPMERNS